MKKLFSILFILLFSTMIFGQAEEYLIRHVGQQYGDYNADSLGLIAAKTYMESVVNADSIGIIWLDFPVDTTGMGTLENIHVWGWVSDGTDTSFITGGLFTGTVQASAINFASATVVAGTGDAITMDFSPDFPALVAGLQVSFVAEAANTGATTLAIDGGTAKAVVEASDGSALEAGDIASGSVVTLVYDGTSWQQVSQSGN
jgi:hypothetical protein